VRNGRGEAEIERNVYTRAHATAYRAYTQRTRAHTRSDDREGDRRRRGRKRKPGAGGGGIGGGRRGRVAARRGGRVQEWIAEFLE